MDSSFDVVVIGGGHAGCEAALAAARMGCKTALLTMNNDHIGYMSCNPAIGGQAKGQLAREVDALGGEMGINTDKSALQYKRLNRSKGPAVWSSRAQCDKVLYSLNMKQVVETQKNLVVGQREVADIKVVRRGVQGVFTNLGEYIEAKAVIVTAGTFLKAVMHCGESQNEGGRAGDGAARKLSEALSSVGFRLVRLKTGTPPRLQKKSIDFSGLVREDGDKDPIPFSFYTRPNPFPYLPQLPCYITYTNPETHAIITGAREKSPMFSGQITGRGPRYCPSIEDKVFRFAERTQHQIFLEPESQFSNEIYANGLSTSLPIETQVQFLRKIPGLENVEIARPGYAVEYDAIDSTILTHGLEVKEIKGLFFAGQVNGTSGYEEAAGQGLIAGINAAQHCLGREPFYLGRDTSYIGVMIDDLVSKGCDEPYRMFTSRAEFRLSLREDSADQRLAQKGRDLGLLSDEKWATFTRKMDKYREFQGKLASTYLYGGKETDRKLMIDMGVTGVLPERISLTELLRRPECSAEKLRSFGISPVALDTAEGDSWLESEILREIETSIKYEGYIKRENILVEKLRKQETRPIPPDFDYHGVVGLSNEVRERLIRIKPGTLGQANRLPGVTPAAVALLYIHLERPNAQL